MFYSQFILAKKGPLGTIWIAAHLERKLRKNQVADTDIGVSVDSILFPDAPIALRLSSHLLLGVVRIYSKKVNYLFNDCSEALIKIKHAFRSTAVDLPPEESTAPYHSITLPENFDLDNFELPDSAFLDSNFVDHHVSAREQITLQDTIKDTAFPTSKFGLDERFGDEDASPIGLELDEELFMDKKASPQIDEVSMSSKVSGSHNGGTSVPSTSMAIDVQFGCDEEKYNEIPNELSELLSNNYDKNCFLGVEDLRRDANSSHRHGYTIQTPDLNEIFQPECSMALLSHTPFTPYDVQTPCLVERAQEPSTPALFEAVPSHLQEVPILSPQEKAETCVEQDKPASSSAYIEIECSEAGKNTVYASATMDHKTGETARGLPLSSALINPMPESLTPTYSNCNLITDNICLVSGTKSQKGVFIGNELNNISTSIHRLDNEEAINTSAFTFGEITLISHQPGACFEADPATSSICTDNMGASGNILDVKSTTPKTASFEAEPATSNICIDNMDASGNIIDVKKAPLKGGNEQTEVANLGHIEDGQSCFGTSVIGTDFLSRSCGSNLPLPSSSSMQTASFEAEHATSCICTDSVDVSGDISDAKRTPMRRDNEPIKITNLGRLEDGHSCTSTSVVESDFLSRSFSSNLRLPTSPFTQTTHFEAEPAASCIYTQNVDVSGVNSDLRRQQKVITATSNLIRGGDVGSDFRPSSSASNLQLPSSIFVDGTLGEASESSLRDHFFSKKTPMREEMQHISRSSVEVQGEALCYTNDLFIEGQHIPGYTTSDMKHCARKPTEQSVSVLSKVSHLDNEKFSSSSEFLVPEKMLAPTFVDFPTYQALQGADKGATQSDGIFDKNSNQFSRKRPLMDSPTILQNTAKLSVLPSSKKRTDYIPDHSDVLTTILDGRTRSLKAGSIPSLSSRTDSIPPLSSKTDSILPLSSKTDSIPPLSKPLSQKRSRTMSRVGMPRKRKVLVDDAMVLHADAIRQQLINTEDIRRMRKKAPCTRPEIWKIFISAMEDDIFDRSILTGITDELNSPCNLKYNAQNDPSPLELNPQVKTFGDRGSSRVLEFVTEKGDIEMNEILSSIHGTVNRNDGPSSITKSATIQAHGSDVQVDLYDQLQNLPHQSQVGSFKYDKVSVISSYGPSEFVHDMGGKDRNERISSVHNKTRNDGSSKITTSASLQINEDGVQHDLYDQLEKLHIHSPAGPFSNNQMSVIGPSGVLEFLNEIGDKDINRRILSDGSSSMTGSFTEQTHEAGAQDNLYDQLQKSPVQPRVGPFISSSRAFEFVNDMADKDRAERISSVNSTNRNDSPSNIIAPAMVQTNEVRVQHDLYDQLQKLPVHSPLGIFSNDQTSVIGSSMVLESLNEMGDKEINERILSVLRSDGPSIINGSSKVQTQNFGAQYNLYDQLQKLPVQSQVGSFSYEQASVNCEMQPDAETRPTSIIQGNPNPEIDKSISSVEKLSNISINLAEEYSSRFLGPSSDKAGIEMNERVSFPSFVNKNFGPTSLTGSATVQPHEGGTYCDMYGQLNKLPVQSQLEPMGNVQGSVACTMYSNVETCSNSIIQGTPIRRCSSSDDKITDKCIDLREGYDALVKASRGRGSMGYLCSQYDGTSTVTSSSSVLTNGGDARYDMHDELGELPVHLEVGPFSNDQASLTRLTQPDAEKRANSIIIENHIPEIESTYVEKHTDKSINITERSLHNDTHNQLKTLDDGSAGVESATLVGIDDDILVERTSQSLIRTEHLCDPVGAIINKEETGNATGTEHSEFLRATDVDVCGGVIYRQAHLLVDRGTELLVGETDRSAVVVNADGGRPVSDVSAEQNRDEGRHLSDATCAGQNIDYISSCGNHAFSTVGENNGIKDIEGGMDVDSIPIDIVASRDSNDFCSAIDDNETVSHLPEFLDDDDDETVNEAEDDVPDPEDAQSLENSGWSARTRGVARYLKNLFDEESGQGRKSIAVNRLLVGKTRKEASRMFFETLVLKTRDYIQVEQEKPYECINITPRLKLLKSEF